MTPPLLSLQQEPSEAPTPKRPRGRPKGSKNKATPKGRVGGWGQGLLRPSSHALGQQVWFELNYRQFGGGRLSVMTPREVGGGKLGIAWVSVGTQAINLFAKHATHILRPPRESRGRGHPTVLEAGGKGGLGGAWLWPRGHLGAAAWEMPLE